MKIYALTDPHSQEVKYIGITNDEPLRRLYRHVGARNDGTARGDWVRALHDVGLRPVITVLEEVDDAEWIEAERRWITHYRGLGHILLNAGDGGPGMSGAKMSEQARQKISNAKRGVSLKFRDPAGRAAKISAAKKGRAMSEETKRKLSEANRGKFKTTPEQQRQILAMFVDGYSRVDIARELGFSKDTIGDVIKRDAMARGIELPRKRSARTIAKMAESNHYRKRAAELASKHNSNSAR